MNRILNNDHTQTNLGLVAGVAAFLLWGFFPIYWKHLYQVPPLHLLAYRIVFCTIFMMLIVIVTRRGALLLKTLKSKKNMLFGFASALLVGANWYYFIAAIADGHILQASLGYYINPLLNVLLGFFFLKERMSRWLLLSFILSTIGVAYYTWSLGTLPFYSVILAVTFALYAYIRKLSPLDAMIGLTLESLLLAPVVLAYLYFELQQGKNYFGTIDRITDLMIIGSGPATALPLILFVFAARRIDLSSLGILQFIAPSCQLFCAVVIYGETFSSAQFVCFSLIWAALLVFMGEQIYKRKRQIQIGM